MVIFYRNGNEYMNDVENFLQDFLGTKVVKPQVERGTNRTFL